MSHRIDRIKVPTASLMIDEDYVNAEITILYNRSMNENERKLIFATVELLPKFTEPGPDIINPLCSRLGKGRNEINLLRFHLSPVDAVTWYRSCLSGEVIIPRASQQTGDLRLKVTPLGEEPPWPSLVCDSHQSPLWGYRPGQSRVHQLMPMDGGLSCLAIWKEEEVNKAREWLTKHFPFDIISRPKLLGSIHLLAPNPVLRDISLRLSEEDSRILCIYADIFPGTSIEGISFVLREYRPRGIDFIVTIPLKGPYTIIDLPHEPHNISFEVICEKRGILSSVPSSAFARKISMSIGISARDRRVHVPARSKNRPAEVYEIPQHSRQPLLIGEEYNGVSALRAVLDDLQDIDYQGNRSSIAQKWFYEDVVSATAYIRSLIGQATKDVFIVDSYFGAIELRRFALATATSGVAVRILTSAEFLRDTAVGTGKTHKEELAQSLEDIRRQTQTNDIDIKVGLGSRAPVHDRFLVIDGRVWIFGSSLNEFGSRGTVVLRAHHDQILVSVLEEVWNDRRRCVPLADFTAENPTGQQ